MKKYILDLVVTQNIKLHANYVLIKLTHANPLPEMLPGQFAEIRIDGSNTTFLRRPISINYVDKTTNEVWFLVQLVGDASRQWIYNAPECDKGKAATGWRWCGYRPDVDARC